ncbi:MAG: hypothetical protein J2O46_07985 [Nocardioides sp.]|nr:hypothetical protein [Nocardioides sp.]
MSAPSPDPGAPTGPAPKASAWAFVGMGAFACLLFLDLAALARTPWWVVLVLVVVWLGLFVAATRSFMPAPRRVVWLALTGLVIWALVVVGGGVLFGWG